MTLPTNDMCMAPIYFHTGQKSSKLLILITFTLCGYVVTLRHAGRNMQPMTLRCAAQS